MLPPPDRKLTARELLAAWAALHDRQLPQPGSNVPRRRPLLPIYKTRAPRRYS